MTRVLMVVCLLGLSTVGLGCRMCISPNPTGGPVFDGAYASALNLDDRAGSILSGTVAGETIGTAGPIEADPSEPVLSEPTPSVASRDPAAGQVVGEPVILSVTDEKVE